MSDHIEYDALVVGLGFGGIYQLKKLLDQGLSVLAIDMASDAGGTWYWNRYPGAMSDTESYLYRYSWDTDDLKTYPWSRHYLYQPEILDYLQHITNKYDLRKHTKFNTELKCAAWDDTTGHWLVSTASTSDSEKTTIKAHYLVTGLGLLSRQHYPEYPGIGDFKRSMYHTGAWPSNVDLTGKKVGIIGNGSTGVQVITAIAPVVSKLVSFQRNPQYSVPSGQGPVGSEYRQQINDNYEHLWREAKDETAFAFGFRETDRKTFSFGPEERERIYERAWKRGGGFRFMFETFGDITTDEEANHAATDFIKRKIRETVKDPEKSRKLMPAQLYARRPLCDAGYYAQFNLPHVDIVSLKETPIVRFTANGIVTSDGAKELEHDLDVIIFATGFDAVDGNYTRLDITGRSGKNLKSRWAETGATSYLGISMHDFPNMFMILGPNGPFCNLPPAIETQVEFISDLIAVAERKAAGGKDGRATVEATVAAEYQWTQLCDDVSKGSLFRKTDSWIFGANVEGKKNSVLFYFPGLASYRSVLRDVVQDGYRGFEMI